MDLIIQHPATWVPMRLTCKTYCSKVEALMYRHIVIRGYQWADGSDYSEYEFHPIFPSKPTTTIRVLSPHLPDLPGFHGELEDTHKSRGQRLYFGRHLKHTKVVDLPFGICQDQVRRILTRRLSVQMVRLYWDAQFAYLSNRLHIVRPSTLVFMHPEYLDIEYSRGSKGVAMALPGATKRVIINGLYSRDTGPSIYCKPLPAKDNDQYTQDFVFILHPWRSSTFSFGNTKEKPTWNHAKWKEFVVVILELLVHSKNRDKPHIAFVDAPSAPCGPPKSPPFQSFSHQLVHVLRYALAKTGYPAPQIKDHLANIEFITKEEHADRVPYDQFLLEYAPPPYVLRR